MLIKLHINAVNNEANEKGQRIIKNTNLYQSLTYLGNIPRQQHSWSPNQGAFVLDCYKILSVNMSDNQNRISLKVIKHTGISTVLIILPNELAMASLIRFWALACSDHWDKNMPADYKCGLYYIHVERLITENISNSGASTSITWLLFTKINECLEM